MQQTESGRAIERALELACVAAGIARTNEEAQALLGNGEETNESIVEAMSLATYKLILERELSN